LKSISHKSAKANSGVADGWVSSVEVPRWVPGKCSDLRKRIFVARIWFLASGVLELVERSGM